MTPLGTPTSELRVVSLGLYDLVSCAIVAAGFALLATFLSNRGRPEHSDDRVGAGGTEAHRR